MLKRAINKALKLGFALVNTSLTNLATDNHGKQDDSYSSTDATSDVHDNSSPDIIVGDTSTPTYTMLFSTTYAAIVTPTKGHTVNMMTGATIIFMHLTLNIYWLHEVIAKYSGICLYLLSISYLNIIILC